ncbi:MAG: aa3-type cytochrome oxidase subunit IV [Acidimicrobiales bacterium]
MKLEYRLMLGVSVFLAVVAIVYYPLSAEDAGSTCLVFGAIAYLMLCGYLGLQYLRRHRILRPEDRLDGKVADAVGPVAFFPAASIWPVSLGIGFVFLALGLVYGAWFWAIGGIVMLGAVIGYNVEANADQDIGGEEHEHAHD